VIKFVSDLTAIRLFFPGTPVSSTNKINCHDITEILLKVALNTINNHHHHFDFFNILLIIDPCISAINKNAQK
jgi:hypothetical protein